MNTLNARRILAGLAFALLPFSAAVQAGPDGNISDIVSVEPVRTADEARQLLEEEREFLPKLTLKIGDKAPALSIAKWVKGESVTQFEEGHIYVVEFWATWCGPCIRMFPHLSELQAEHADAVTVMGVNIWDRPKSRETGEYTQTMQEMVDRVTEFVKEQGERMSYSVAIEETDKMAEAWMRAAGQNGIPAAFIVDRSGTVTWIGHPAAMDDPLERIIAGEWDPRPAAAAQHTDHEINSWYPHLMNLLSNRETAERGYRLGYALLRSPFANESRMLNAVAWNVLTSPRIPVRDRDMAIAMASVACEKTEWKDASIIDTLARGYFDKDDHARAIDLQERAVTLAEGTPMEADLRQTLERYRKGSSD